VPVTRWTELPPNLFTQPFSVSKTDGGGIPRETLRKALELKPGPYNLNIAAYRLALAGTALDQAQTWAQQAVAATEAALSAEKERNPLLREGTTRALATYWDTLGWVLYRKGDPRAALSYLQAGARLGGTSEEIGHLRQVLEALGQREGLAGRAEPDTTLDAPGLEPGTADFLATVGPGGQVFDVRIHAGLAALQPLEKALLQVRHPFLFPEGSVTRLSVRIKVTLPRGSQTATVRFPDGKAALVGADATDLGSAGASVPRLIPVSMVASLTKWAGPEGVAQGFTPDRLQAFLEARRVAVLEPLPAPVMAWLKELGDGPVPSLAAWALARRLEAGDFAAFPAYKERLFDHVYGISKPGSGRGNAVLQDPPFLARALAVDPAAPFWQVFASVLEQKLDSPMDLGHYAVWSYGTAPGQRALILKQAAQVKLEPTVKNARPDPWNDPRFWITVDWAMAWGAEADFQAIAAALPEGAARAEFARIQAQADKLQGFWQVPVPPAQPGAKDPAKNPIGPGVLFEFGQMRVKLQPPAPSYPVEAKVRRLMSVVKLALTVGPDGVPLAGRLLPGPWLAFFGPTAYAYGMTWRFEPALLNGVPQTARFLLTMPFHLR